MKSSEPLYQLKKDVIRCCHLLHIKGFVAATDGNISVKTSNDRYLITPTQFNKGLLTEEDLIIIDGKGKVLTGKTKPSSEYRMHIKAYELRPDIRAVVHAHPPYLTAFSIAGKEIPQDVLPEVVLTLGRIPTTQYATPSTPEVAEVIEDLIQQHDAITLNRHGSLTVGKTVFDAYNKLEKAEHAALITLIAKSLGQVQHLEEDHLEKLLYMAHQLGIRKDLKPPDQG